MAEKLNCKRLDLETDEFAEMPDSWCDNILPKIDPKKRTVIDKNDWRNVFDDFLREDILIETCRFFKLRAILKLCEGTNEISKIFSKFVFNQVRQRDTACHKEIQKRSFGSTWLRADIQRNHQKKSEIRRQMGQQRYQMQKNNIYRKIK